MRTLIVVAVLLATATACAGPSSPTASVGAPVATAIRSAVDSGPSAPASARPTVAISIGTSTVQPNSPSPAETSTALETPLLIPVTLSDALRIEPSQLDFVVGQTVTFVITNSGGIVHEFFVGDAAAQAAREAELVASGGDDPDDTPTGRAIAPGHTEELTYVFTQPGPWLAGCHVTNHYSGGMKADITVDPGP